MTNATKALIGILGGSSIAAIAFTLNDRSSALAPRPSQAAAAAPSAPVPTVSPSPGRRAVTVALSQWPGHLALVVGNGGLTTQAGSAAAAEGLDLNVVFIEDAPA